MAIDTQEKRQNAAGVGRAWMRGSRFPVGATDEQSRTASGLGYGGLTLTPTVSAAAIITLENIAGAAPSLSSIAGNGPSLATIAGRSPLLDDIDGKG